MDLSTLIAKIDYTFLKPTATRNEIKQFCHEAIQYQFNVVFVNPYYLSFAKHQLADQPIKIGIPIGFSLGGATTRTKVFETKEAVRSGASEIDMLINLGAMKSKLYDIVKQDISEVIKAAEGALTKVIIETALLTQEEKRIAAEIACEAGADFVKTSTGFNGGGATVEDVKRLKQIVGPMVGVKAAGGIRTYNDAMKMIEAGADRLGTSGAISIVTGKTSTQSY
ncbi:deoxyribose-phosphate aldolase [Amphibacillus cookii]|uniref:deoxyribose-phosphate aldolase n=1 Tax=Amphibacillus cookii TaxID=767787 RepID=UPI00195E1939|nr:deoxyribose-phosphate aldolase [Amphibacillus cookii]MBM7541338.1 deoxyribose-phosphate aldolase [Amphibacillus cookii]